MNKAIALIKLYVNSVYGLSSLIRDFKDNKKSALKTIGLIILVLFSFSGIVTMFTAFNLKMFDTLKQINQQGLVVLNTIIISTAFTFFIGILTVIATYYLNQEGDIILSLPLKPWNLFLAKFVVSYISEAIIASIVMATGVLVYGIKDGEGFIFYILSIVVTLMVPILPLVIGYFLITPIMKFGKLLKKKDLIMYISGFFAILIGLVFQYFSNTMVQIDKNPELVMQKLTAPNGFLDLTSRIYYPAVIATKALVFSGTLKGILFLFAFILIALGSLAILLLTMSNLYYDTLIGSTELQKSTKKMNEIEFKRALKRRNIFLSLLDREIKLMNREPVYFINGPMVVFLVPVIMGASFYFQRNSMLLEFKEWMNNPNFFYYLNLISIGSIVFLGASTSITATCISREGRTFEVIKSLPIKPKLFILAKLIHGIIFGLLAAVIVIVIDIIIFKVSLLNSLLILAISNLILLVIFILEIFAELKWPRLIWDNPQKAIKQNINGMVGIFGTMGLVALLGALIIGLKIKAHITYIILIFIPLLSSIFLYNKLMTYSVKRFYEIEI